MACLTVSIKRSSTIADDRFFIPIRFALNLAEVVAF